MSTIQSFIMTSCVLSIIFSIFASIIDLSKFEKEFKFLLVGIFSIMLMKSILQLDFSFFKDISLTDNPYYNENTSKDYTISTTKTTLENSIKDLLTNHGISYENISVDINITENNCISINRVYLLVDDFSNASRLIIDNFGNIEVINLTT